MGRPTSGYRNAAGDRVPGVTTVIGRFKESGALLHWAFAQGKLAEQGKIKDLYDSRDKAADAGTLAHELIEASIRNLPPPAVPDSPIGEKAQNAFAQYQKWASMTGLVIVDTEMPLVSEEFQFGGTPDAIGEINGETVLVDWKTSNGVYADYLVQLAAYKHLIEANTTWRITGGFHLLRFAKETADFVHHYWSELDDGWEQFQLFRRAYDLDKKLKART